MVRWCLTLLSSVIGAFGLVIALGIVPPEEALAPWLRLLAALAAAAGFGTSSWRIFTFHAPRPLSPTPRRGDPVDPGALAPPPVPCPLCLGTDIHQGKLCDHKTSGLD